jgi:hypothetical protein
MGLATYPRCDHMFTIKMIVANRRDLQLNAGSCITHACTHTHTQRTASVREKSALDPTGTESETLCHKTTKNTKKSLY